MARISQYKALGTGLGGYKTTLSKVQSMEYAKKHSDWKAGEQKSLYNEIGGTVSNILGIAKEKHLLNEQKARQQKFDDKYIPLDKPDRPVVEGPAMYSPEELDIEDMPSDITSDFDASGDTTATVAGKDDPYGYEEGVEYMTVPGFDKMGVNLQKKEETKVDYSGAVTAGQGATQYKKITSKPDYRDIIKKHTGAGALPIGTGVAFAEKGVPKQEDFSVQNAMVDQWIKDDADNPLFNKKKLEELEAGDRNVARAREIEDEKKRMIAEESNQTPVGSTEKELFEIYGPHPDDLGVDAKSIALNAPLDPVVRPDTSAITPETVSPPTDDMAFNTLTDTSLGDFSTDELPPTMIEQQFIDRMKERGINISLKEISELVNQFASVETGGKDIRQITPDDVKSGRKIGTGKGAGFFQFETGSKQEFETALNRVTNIYKDRNKKVPDWVAKARKAGSPIGLSKHIQRELLLANIYQQEQSVNLSKKSGGKPFDIMERAFENMDFSELWAKKHWKGAEQWQETPEGKIIPSKEYEAKIGQFQRDKGRYKF